MLLVPTFPDDTNYSLQVNLDGTLYLLAFRYSEREQTYWIDLSLADGTLLVGGKRVVCKVSLFARQRYDLRVPQGHLVAFPTEGASDDPPALGELGEGRRVVLFYASKNEIGG